MKRMTDERRMQSLPARQVVARAILGTRQAIPLAAINRRGLIGPFGWDQLECGHWASNPFFDNQTSVHGCSQCAAGERRAA